LRVVSTELRQVFKAYTRQLRHAPTGNGKESADGVHCRQGFEHVELSAEARMLAASTRDTQRSDALDLTGEEPAEQEQVEQERET
jgi:hypothetical protein